MPKVPEVLLPAGSRIALFGRAGSGKTTWARWYLARSPLRSIVLDSKHDPGFDRWLPSDRLLKMDEIEQGWTMRRCVVVRPSPHQSDPAILDSYLLDIHDAFENVLVHVDEGYQVATGATAGPGLTGLMTRGRVRGQSVIVGSQRPAWLPRFVFSEANAFCVMALTLSPDRARVYEFTGKSAVLNRLPDREWLWYDVARDRLTRFRAILLKDANRETVG